MFKNYKFKKSIAGIFDDWQLTRSTLTKNDNRIYIATSFEFFEEDNEILLKPFSTSQQKAIYREALKTIERKLEGRRVDEISRLLTRMGEKCSKS